MQLAKFSMGIGDRFGRQGAAQLRAMMKARAEGVDVIPVWNKSNREHQIIGTRPEGVRNEAEEAVKSLGWTKEYHVDADHIGLKTVDGFLAASDFFTIDVADFTGQAASEADLQFFAARCSRFKGTLQIPGIDQSFEIDSSLVERVARKYLLAVKEAGKIYRHISAAKGEGNFITEVSMDETDAPQTPLELFFILAALAEEQIPAQTIAPKFTGRFNKGVDYVGDVSRFEKEFNDDLAVLAFAISECNLPAQLKLSVHSGSDKFSLYGPIQRALTRFDAGLHLKTAGTTWLEELIGLAMAGGEGLEIAKRVYQSAYRRYDEMAGPYATVIDIDPRQLPAPEDVYHWSEQQYADALRHDLACPSYNLHFRQLLHVGYKVAAEMGALYLNALEKYEKIIAENVTENIYERHLKKVFLGH
jgi:tagaturonate epimerase